MSFLDLAKSIKSASERFNRADGRSRSDKGKTRLAPSIVNHLARSLGGQERPAMKDVLAQLAAYCQKRGLSCPARATVYNFLPRARCRTYRLADLPKDVRQALYNLDGTQAVPGPQLAFYCLNYGNSQAASFAASLPWLALYQADRMRGWRKRSHGLLKAIRKTRGI